MGRGDFEEKVRFFAYQAVFFQVHSVRIAGDQAQQLVTQRQPALGVGLFLEGLFEYPGDKGCIACRLFFRIDLAEHTAQFRLLVQGIAQRQVDQRLIDARTEPTHGASFLRAAK